MHAWFNRKLDTLWMNRGLFKKMFLYMGLPTLFFTSVVVYLAASGGVSNYSITGYGSDFIVSSNVLRGTRLVLTSIIFVLIPLYISVMALVRKSMAYRVAAVVANLFAIIYLTTLL